MQETKMTTQNRAPDKANVIAAPPLIYGAVLGLGLLIHFAFPTQFLPQKPALWLGVLLIMIAGAIVVSAMRALARAKTTFAFRKPSTAIVTDGVFRYSRNPMYLSITLLYLGIASLVNSLWIFLFVMPIIVVMRWGVVKREEVYLERKFGEEYLRYKTRVRRWI